MLIVWRTNLFLFIILSLVWWWMGSEERPGQGGVRLLQCIVSGVTGCHKCHNYWGWMAGCNVTCTVYSAPWHPSPPLARLSPSTTLMSCHISPGSRTRSLPGLYPSEHLWTRSSGAFNPSAAGMFHYCRPAYFHKASCGSVVSWYRVSVRLEIRDVLLWNFSWENR